MVLTAVRGGIGFLSRAPIGRDGAAWEAFRATPVAFPIVGYLIGGALAIPFVLPLPAPTLAVLFVCWLYLITGINHVDGVADLGDAVVVHGDRERRREVLQDTTSGVGAVLAVGTVLLGLGFAGLLLATGPVRVLAIVIAAEVGAKLGMAGIAAFGTAAHEGLGAALTSRSRPWSIVSPTLVALPAGALTIPHPAAGVALGSAVLTTGGVVWWAQANLGGMSGDIFGASNELARIVALHAGVSAWMLW